MRRIGFLACCAVLLAACGNSALTVPEYAAEVEELVADMESRFEWIDTEWLSEPPSAERAADYWDERLDIREDFLDAITGLSPPERVASMHAESVHVFERMTAADEALAAAVAELDEVAEHWQWVDTPEGRAADAVLADVFAFCRASQEEFDATGQGPALDGVPWLSAEEEAAVKVAFGCPPP